MIENIDEIKANIQIKDIVEYYLPLKKSGGNFIANCPFHEENTPSFFVNVRKNIFHCFGCEAGGNGIDFIMQYEKLSFYEAIKSAASICNVSIHETTSKKAQQAQTQQKDIQERLHRLEERQYKELLKQEKLLTYLAKRGFEKEHLQDFHIGYALGKHEVIDILGNYALELGFITQNGYNFFQDRILFTIRDKANNIVGFSGRTHPYTNFKNQVKYLNSKESFLYKKKEVLYNLEHAKRLLQKVRYQYIFIVEGYFDALTCTLLHIPAVAICGTAFNKSHLSLLQRYIKEDTKIFIALDNDNAGIQASIRTFKECMKNGFIEAQIARLKGNYKDINEAFIAGATKKPFVTYSGLEFCLQHEVKEAKSIKQAQENLKFYMQFYTECKDKIIQEYMYPLMRDYIHAANIHTHAPQKQEASQDELFILSHIAQNEDCHYIAATHLDSSYFFNKETYSDLLHKKDTPQTRFFAMQEVTPLSAQEFYTLIKRFRIFTLETMYKNASQKKPLDYSYLHTLSQTIHELKQELKH